MNIQPNIWSFIRVAAGLAGIYIGLRMVVQYVFYPGYLGKSFSSIILSVRHRANVFLQSKPRLARAALVLKHQYNYIFRKIPRHLFISSGITTIILTLFITWIVYSFAPSSSKILATVTAIYASILLSKEIFQNNGMLKIRTVYQRDINQQGTLWVGAYIVNVGDSSIGDIEPRFRIYDENGLLISEAWDDMRRDSPSELRMHERFDEINLNPGEKTELMKLPLHDFSPIKEKDAEGMDQISKINFIPDGVDLDFPIYIEMWTESPVSYPFLDDRIFYRVDPDIERDEMWLRSKMHNYRV